RSPCESGAMVAGAVEPGGTIGGLGAPPAIGGAAGAPSGTRVLREGLQARVLPGAALGLQILNQRGQGHRRVERRDRRCDLALTRLRRAAWLCRRERRATHGLPAAPAPTATTAPIARLDEGLHQGLLTGVMGDAEV